MSEVSALERARAEYRPRLPAMLRRAIADLAIEEAEASTAMADAESIARLFPRSFGAPVLKLIPGGGPARGGPYRVGVVLSGGQAPGGHNVVAGIFDRLARTHPASTLLGFRGGPRGVFEREFVELTAERVEPYRNTGGFDLIGSGRDKIESEEQLEACLRVTGELELDGLVVVGGDDSNTNAAVLAEFFASRAHRTNVIGVPKTIDGDLKGERIEASFGFDTATRVYSELIGNICRDAKSAGKYWHFIKLMGRSASHVTLECALQTRPNVTLIAEEVAERGWTLAQVVEHIADAVTRRAAAGRSHGVCLVPEGLIEFIPEMRELIAGLNEVLAAGKGAEALDPGRRAVLDSLPASIREQLLLDRDSHGNVQVSRIQTEQLLLEKVRERVGIDMNGMSHFFGYEGRCSAPTNFDADYTYGLGCLAATLVAFGRTGCICSIRGLADGADAWTAEGVPLTSLMQVETRHGKPKPVIAKALVRTDAEPFRTFQRERSTWETEDAYLYPGPIQFFGPESVCARPSRTLQLERGV